MDRMISCIDSTALSLGCSVVALSFLVGQVEEWRVRLIAMLWGVLFLIYGFSPILKGFRYCNEYSHSLRVFNPWRGKLESIQHALLGNFSHMRVFIVFP